MGPQRLGPARALHLAACGAGLLVALTVAQAHAQMRVIPRGQPTPYPLPSIGPASVPTALPYPAYGTPAPGVGAGTPAPGIPQRITLQQAMDIGYALSPTLATARADVGVARALVRLQRAGLLPSVSGTITTVRAHQQQAGVSAGGGSSRSSGGTTGGSGAADLMPGASPAPTITPAPRPSVVQNVINNFTGPVNVTSNQFGLSVQQLIFDGGRVAAAVRAAERSETASADTYRRALQTVAFNVATAYYNYLEAQRTTAVDVEIVRENQVQEQLVTAQIRAGTAARADIANVQLPTAQARLAVVRAQGSELAAQAAFANAMGLNADTNVQPIDDTSIAPGTRIPTIPVPTYVQAQARGLAMRPDYDAGVANVQSAQYSLRAARLGMFPTVAGVASVGTSSSDTGGGSFRNSSSIGISVSLPIFDQGVTAANTAQAQANLEIAQGNLQNTRLGIQLNIKQALTNLVSSKAALDQTSVELNTALILLRSTQAQYRAGVTTLPLLLNAQVQLTQALTDRVTAIYNLRLAEQQYLYSTGEIGR